VTQDEAMVRKFVQEQFRKIFIGRVSLNKYTFAREFRGRSGYKPTAVVPALEIAK
jgi:DNA polymerase zeta